MLVPQQHPEWEGCQFYSPRGAGEEKTHAALTFILRHHTLLLSRARIYKALCFYRLRASKHCRINMHILGTVSPSA